MTVQDLTGTTAIITGASRGFGRAIAAAFVAVGARVVGVARDPSTLAEAAEDIGPGFVPVAGDVADADFVTRLVAEHRPRTLVLNAGAAPRPGVLSQQTWDDFTVSWNTDVRQAFTFAREALTLPLEPGSTVISFSSGAAVAGSPLSGGYAGAKATVKFISAYADAESTRRDLGIRFVAVLPTMNPATGFGASYARAYAELGGITEAQFVDSLGTTLAVEQIGKAVLDLATDDAYRSPAYLLGGAGIRPLS